MQSAKEFRVLFLITMDRKTQNKITTQLYSFAVNHLNSTFVYNIPSTTEEAHKALQKQWDIIFVENNSFRLFSKLAIKLVAMPTNNLTDLIVLNKRLRTQRLHEQFAKQFRGIFLVDYDVEGFLEAYLEKYNA